MVKKIAVYGSYLVKIPVVQRYWKRRKDGIWQRYRKKTRRLKTVTRSGRYEFYGKGKDLYKAVVKAHKFVPKGFVTVSARKFVEQPERYGLEGEWIEREVES
jgi:predicted cupin superfamily sugar epimerase